MQAYLDAGFLLTAIIHTPRSREVARSAGLTILPEAL
jgi:hypothetical protein